MARRKEVTFSSGFTEDNRGGGGGGGVTGAGITSAVVASIAGAREGARTSVGARPEAGAVVCTVRAVVDGRAGGTGTAVSTLTGTRKCSRARGSTNGGFIGAIVDPKGAVINGSAGISGTIEARVAGAGEGARPGVSTGTVRRTIVDAKGAVINGYNKKKRRRKKKKTFKP